MSFTAISSSCVTLGKSLKLSEPKSKSMLNSICLIDLLPWEEKAKRSFAPFSPALEVPEVVHSERAQPGLCGSR